MITAATIVQEGLERFPEARVQYDSIIEEWNGKSPGLYNIYMDVFRPLLISGLELRDDKLIARFGVFFEEIFTSSDAEAQNIIWLKFFKWLFVRETELDRFLPFCGAAMRDAASRWNISSSIRSKLLC
jgi:hypothetical protein